MITTGADIDLGHPALGNAVAFDLSDVRCRMAKAEGIVVTVNSDILGIRDGIKFRVRAFRRWPPILDMRSSPGRRLFDLRASR
jgi:hypothetical protein